MNSSPPRSLWSAKILRKFIQRTNYSLVYNIYLSLYVKSHEKKKKKTAMFYPFHCGVIKHCEKSSTRHNNV